MNPVGEIKSAAVSAFNWRKLLALLFAFALLAIIFDALNLTNWFIRPVASFKEWNAARKAKAGTA